MSGFFQNSVIAACLIGIINEILDLKAGTKRKMKRRYKIAIWWIVIAIEFAMIFAVIMVRWSKSTRFGLGLRRTSVSSIRDADAGRQRPEDRC